MGVCVVRSSLLPLQSSTAICMLMMCYPTMSHWSTCQMPVLRSSVVVPKETGVEILALREVWAKRALGQE